MFSAQSYWRQVNTGICSSERLDNWLLISFFCSIHVFHNMCPCFRMAEITDIALSQFWYPLFDIHYDFFFEYFRLANNPSSVCTLSALTLLTHLLWFVMMIYVTKINLFVSATMYQLMGFPCCRPLLSRCTAKYQQFKSGIIVITNACFLATTFLMFWSI